MSQGSNSLCAALINAFQKQFYCSLLQFSGNFITASSDCTPASALHTISHSSIMQSETMRAIFQEFLPAFLDIQSELKCLSSICRIAGRGMRTSSRLGTTCCCEEFKALECVRCGVLFNRG